MASRIGKREYQTDHVLTTSLGWKELFVLSLFVASMGLWGATYTVANSFGFHENLGRPVVEDVAMWIWAGGLVFMIGLVVFAAAGGNWMRVPLLLLGGASFWLMGQGPVYSPIKVIEWVRLYGDIEGFGDVMAEAQVNGLGAAGIWVMAIAAGMVKSGRRKATNSHGTAKWGKGKEYKPSHRNRLAVKRTLECGGETSDKPESWTDGLIIGRDPETGELMWSEKFAHVFTVAPTRTGKGTGSVIPNLLYYSGSAVVNDTKGENFQVTAQRRFNMGQETFALDPFEITLEPEVMEQYEAGFEPASFMSRFNPLEMVDVTGPGSHRDVDDAQLLASMLILDENGGKDNAHWIDEARALLAGLMIHIAVESEIESKRGQAEHFVRKKDLLELRRLITLPAEAFDDLFEHMARSPHEMARRTANRIMQKADRERSGVISTAQSNTGFLDSKAMRKVLDSESPLRRVPIERLKDDLMTIYLILPPKYLKSHAAWLRLMVVCVIQTMTSTQRPPSRNTVMFLDEFANLGYMEPVLTNVSLVGGYGLSFYLYVQDIAQLKGVYGESFGTLMDNCSIKQAFGTAGHETAELLSLMMGETTVFSEGGSRSMGQNLGFVDSNRNLNTGESVSETGRRLMMADEVMTMDASEQLLLVSGQQPVITKKVFYPTDPEFQGLFLDNPMFRT